MHSIESLAKLNDLREKVEAKRKADLEAESKAAKSAGASGSD